MPMFCYNLNAAAPSHACYCCRGIDVVRNKIKMFAQTKVTLPPGRHKMVILDEADRYVLLAQNQCQTMSSCSCKSRDPLTIQGPFLWQMQLRWDWSFLLSVSDVYVCMVLPAYHKRPEAPK